MYSPKIREDLIPQVYRLAKAVGVKMTTLVNQILERALNEISWLEAEEDISNDSALILQKGLEEALNGIREEIRSSLVDQRKEATLTGEFKISINKKAKLSFVTKRAGSIRYPMIREEEKEVTHETARIDHGIGKAKAAEVGSEDRLIETDNDAGGSDAEISNERQQFRHHPALPQPDCGEA